MTEQLAGAIPSHSSATSDAPWDGPAQEAKLANDAGAAVFRREYAWVDSAGDPATKAAYKFPHHFVTGPRSVGAASTTGCSSGIAVLNGGRGGSKIPSADRRGVYGHLAGHLRAAGKTPAPLAQAPADEASGDREYDHVMQYVSGVAWAMEPAAFARVLAILGERRSGHRPSVAEIRARIGPREHRDATPATPGIAIIPIVGSILPKAALFSQTSSSGTSIEGLQAQFRAALASADVAAIVFDVDSPGGSVDLVPEFAAEVLAARGRKPIVAVADTMAASAAYWIASAADELVVTPSGDVGSIGVYAAHQDLSAQMEQKGIKTTLVSAGEYKVEGNPFEPLSETAQAEMQSTVDTFYRMFVGAVAEHRGIGPADVEERFGQGRMVLASDAVARGMADRVDTLDGAIARLAAPREHRARDVVIVGRHAPAPAGAPELVKRLLTVEREVRSVQLASRPIEVRDKPDGSIDVCGYCAVFGDVYEVHDARYGTFDEEVLPGAFTKTLRDADVRYMLNHDDLPLARTKSGTLYLEQNDVGLWYEARNLDPSDPDVQRLVPKLRRRDLAESSFGFLPMRQIWNRDYTHRQLVEVELFDVSTVTWAASTSTSSTLRAADLVRDLAQANPDELLVQVRSAGAGDLHAAARQALELLEHVLGMPPSPAFGTPPEEDEAAARDTPETLFGDEAQRAAELLRLRAP